MKTLVTGCADGYQAFKVLYDKFSLKGDLEVLHITEYIDKLIKEGKLELTKKVNMNVTYHDPCNLGRLGEPWISLGRERRFRGTGICLIHPKNTGEANMAYMNRQGRFSSIPGVTLSEMTGLKNTPGAVEPEAVLMRAIRNSPWTAKESVDEAVSTGAEAIVTACPWCEKNLNEAIKASGSSLKVYDIVELVEKQSKKEIDELCF